MIELLANSTSRPFGLPSVSIITQFIVMIQFKMLYQHKPQYHRCSTKVDISDRDWKDLNLSHNQIVNVPCQPERRSIWSLNWASKEFYAQKCSYFKAIINIKIFSLTICLNLICILLICYTNINSQFLHSNITVILFTIFNLLFTFSVPYFQILLCTHINVCFIYGI